MELKQRVTWISTQVRRTAPVVHDQGLLLHYIAYEDLKDALKTQYVTEPTPANPKPDRKPWTEEDEKRFVFLLE